MGLIPEYKKKFFLNLSFLLYRTSIQQLTPYVEFFDRLCWLKIFQLQMHDKVEDEEGKDELMDITKLFGHEYEVRKS